MTYMATDFDIYESWRLAANFHLENGDRFTTRGDLAKHLDVTASYMSKLLNGKLYGAEEIRRATAEAFGYQDLDSFLRFGRSLLEQNQKMSTQAEEFRRGLLAADLEKAQATEAETYYEPELTKKDRQDQLVDYFVGRMRALLDKDPELYHYFKIRLETIFREVEPNSNKKEG